MRRGAADPRRPSQTLEVVPVAACRTLPVVALLRGIRPSPCVQALLVYISLTAFTFARAEKSTTIFTLVCDSWRGLNDGGQGGCGVIMEGGLHYLQADSTLAGRPVSASPFRRWLVSCWFWIGSIILCCLWTIFFLLLLLMKRAWDVVREGPAGACGVRCHGVCGLCQ